MRQEPSGGGEAKIEKIRETYPNAYTAWTEEDDRKLMEHYRAKARISDLSETLGRQPSAIRARLEKVLPREAPD